MHRRRRRVRTAPLCEVVIFLLAVVTMQPVAIFPKDHMVAAPNSVVLNQDGVARIVLISLLVPS